MGSFLELSSDPVRFEAGNHLTNVFFDDSNKHVFTVRSSGVMGVVVKGPNLDSLSFRMEDHGPVISIKFNCDLKILAVQRSTASVEFMNFNIETNNLDTEYSQQCKKNSTICGFVWTQNNEIAIMTDHGIELYMVIPDKKICKLLKSTSVTINWFVWCSLNKIAFVASSHGSHLQPILFKPSTTIKLNKVETEPGRMALERDVTLATLYGVPSILIVRHQNQASEIHVHTLSGPGQAPIKSHVLKLGLSGRFAVNIVDDLILVHHQASRSSQIFDIALSGESDGNVRYHTSIVPPKSIKLATLKLPGLSEDHQTHICELYSPNWVVFQPDIIIDAKLGVLWHIKLCLNELLNSISDLEICTQITLKRTNGKSILLKLLLDAIEKDKPQLDKIQASYNHINIVYRDWMEAQLDLQTASPASLPIIKQINLQLPRVLIDQNDIFNEIIQKLDNDLNKIEWNLICYITSLAEYNIPSQFNLNKSLITVLAKKKKFTTLQQLLQYGVVTDSKPLATWLLSLANLHPSTSQLALDMLARLNATEEMQLILIDKKQIISALLLGQNNPRKFLEIARDDELLFHSILHSFKHNYQFNMSFKDDERLKEFVNHYNKIYCQDKDSSSSSTSTNT